MNPSASVKILDVSDVTGGVAAVHMERADGTRLASLLTPDQLIYFHARLTAICAKLDALEKPFA
jgi:hypothetical protein